VSTRTQRRPSARPGVKEEGAAGNNEAKAPRKVGSGRVKVQLACPEKRKHHSYRRTIHKPRIVEMSEKRL